MKVKTQKEKKDNKTVKQPSDPAGLFVEGFGPFSGHVTIFYKSKRMSRRMEG